MKKKNIVILCDSYFSSWIAIKFCMNKLYNEGDEINLVQNYTSTNFGKMLTRNISDKLKHIALNDLKLLNNKLKEKYKINNNQIHLDCFNDDFDLYISKKGLTDDSIIIIPSDTISNTNIFNALHLLKGKPYVLIILPEQENISKLSFVASELNNNSMKILELSKNYIEKAELDIEIHLPENIYEKRDSFLQVILNKLNKHKCKLIKSNKNILKSKIKNNSNTINHEIIIFDLIHHHCFKKTIKARIGLWFLKAKGLKYY